ncbi:MAG TPA: hypothetical protein VHU23_17095 [Rhizomicrobium sp.]|jgi:hypothetical protein|nr:hypothetical protein [Rhizomicrobium sp.]
MSMSDALPARPAGSPETQIRSGRLQILPAEYFFLGLVILGWAVMVVARGKDESWDFRNYHWYIPYAFLDHRLGFDIAVAHQATYYNPFLDTPFYLLATHVQAWLALGILGAVQGASVIPLYLLCRSLLRIGHGRFIAAILALVSMLGSLNLYLAGSTYYDNVMSLFVLSSLALIIIKRDVLATGSPGRGALIAFLAALLTGSAVGLKLPEAPFALGFAAALAILPGDGRHRTTRLLAGALGGIAGFALFDGYWMIEMARLTGNPIFPYFNEYFHSPLALAAPYRDMRFLPRTFEHQLLFPLLFSIDWRVADDLPFHDIRVGVAYVLMIMTLPFLFFTRRKRNPVVVPEAAAALFAFAAVSYIAWLRMFAIYRYILLLEMLAPLLIAAAIGLWPMPARARLMTAAVVLLLILASTKAFLPERAPVTDPYVQVSLPPIPHPGRSMILMTGEAPLGYLASSLPPQIPILRIDGWLIQPQDGSHLTAATRKRVAAFRGDLFVIADAGEILRSRDALAMYGLAMRAAQCRNIETNLAGPYRFCPLAHIGTQHP